MGDVLIEYFVQITTCVPVPGGSSYRSFTGCLDLTERADEGRLFWEAVDAADRELRRYNDEGLEFENDANLIFYRIVKNER